MGIIITLGNEDMIIDSIIRALNRFSNYITHAGGLIGKVREKLKRVRSANSAGEKVY